MQQKPLLQNNIWHFKNILRWLDIEFFHSFTRSLPDHSYKAIGQRKHCIATILCHINKLTNKFWQVCTLVFPIIF